jgi:SulP family sulfate permease
MDITGIRALEEAIRDLERRGVRLLLCEARRNVLRKLVRAGLVGKHRGPRCYFRDLGTALQASLPAQ